MSFKEFQETGGFGFIDCMSIPIQYQYQHSVKTVQRMGEIIGEHGAKRGQALRVDHGGEGDFGVLKTVFDEALRHQGYEIIAPAAEQGGCLEQHHLKAGGDGEYRLIQTSPREVEKVPNAPVLFLIDDGIAGKDVITPFIRKVTGDYEKPISDFYDKYIDAVSQAICRIRKAVFDGQNNGDLHSDLKTIFKECNRPCVIDSKGDWQEVIDRIEYAGRRGSTSITGGIVWAIENASELGIELVVPVVVDDRINSCLSVFKRKPLRNNYLVRYIDVIREKPNTHRHLKEMDGLKRLYTNGRYI